MSENNIVKQRGIGNYCWLARPDTTFDPDGSYSTNLIVSKENAKANVALIKQMHKDAQIEFKKKNKSGKQAGLPFKVNEDGDIEFKMTQRAVIKNKKGERFKKTVLLLDSKRKPCKANVGKGSELIVAFEPVTYYHPIQGAGVTLRLKAVQIVNLVEYAGGTDYGFDEEDGFEADDTNADDDDGDMFDDNEDSNEEEDDSGEEEDEDTPF